ncbi:hypothetical protein [Ferrovum myxofaciens]|uniref:hypothetical protein n=2 Tax=Ferrovum myxofaciens TaxID=416213 RepID=UPI0023543DDC|nr:hypothetical protein [Ferrovum myxofaciens]
MALQGLAYWIGYKRALYRDYPLSEGALVTELRSLIHANLPDDLFLKCEIGYSNLVKGVRPPAISGGKRADMVIANRIKSKTKAGKMLFTPRFVMEFKRAGAPPKEITKDLHRLAALKMARPEVRAFLLVLSESSRNDCFVTERGKSRLGKQHVPDSTAMFYVRRTLKAAPAYENRESANYASIIEVYA